MRTLFLAITTMLMLASFGYSQHSCPGMDMMRMDNPKSMQHETMMMSGLSSEQKMQMDAIMDETQKKIIPLKAEIEIKNIDLKNEMMQDKPNRDKIMKIIADINALELKIKQTDIDGKLKAHALLTPEQREQMMSSMPMHESMMMEMHNK